MPEIKDYIREAINKGYSEEEIYDLFSKKGYSVKEIKSGFNSFGTPRQAPQILEEISAVKKIGLTFSDPKGFFDKVQDKGIGKSLLLLFTVCICAFVIGGIGMFLFSAFREGYRIGFVYGSYLAIFFVFIFALSLLFSFIYAGFSHAIIKGFGGQGNYKDTFNAVVYSCIPACIFSLIPIVGMLSFVYSIVLMTFGYSKYHNISYDKALTAALVPILLVIGVLIVLIIFLM